VAGEKIFFLTHDEEKYLVFKKVILIRFKNIKKSDIIMEIIIGKGKGKAHPLQAMRAQRGLGELRILDFLTSALYGGRLSASRTGRLYPQGHPW
jgi:hypothetical protein